MQRVPQIGAGLGSDLRPGRERVPQATRAHLGDEPLEKAVEHPLDHDEPLGRDAALATVDEPRVGRGSRRHIEVGVLEHDERIAAAQLEHALLEVTPGLRGHRGPRSLAPGEGHGPHARVRDHARDGLGADQQGTEDAVGKSGIAEYFLDLQGAARHVGGMLQQTGVAGHQRRRSEPEHLPEREVPGHHGEDRPERIEPHEAARGVALVGLVGEKIGGALGVVVAGPRTLLRLGFALRERLPHLERHGTGVRALALAQQPRGAAHQPRPLPEVAAPPVGERPLGPG